MVAIREQNPPLEEADIEMLAITGPQLILFLIKLENSTHANLVFLLYAKIAMF